MEGTIGMNNALVTGASSGIGRAISDKLIEMGYNVYGIGRTFDNGQMLPLTNFHKIELDLRDTDLLIKTVTDINKDNPISVLVNSAGVAYYGLHDSVNANMIKEMSEVNLMAPMILSNLLIKTIRDNKGAIVNVSSVTATKASPHGAAYGATKAGLTSFSKSIFEEYRKFGVRVIDIKPDMTKTNLYRNADFAPDEDCLASLEPTDVAEAFYNIMRLREGVCVNEIMLTPQLKRIKRG